MAPSAETTRLLQTRRRNNPALPLGVACGIVASYDFLGAKVDVSSDSSKFFSVFFA